MTNGFKVMDSDMPIIAPSDLWQRDIDSASLRLPAAAEGRRSAPKGRGKIHESL
jgi:hypothetical protein